MESRNNIGHIHEACAIARKKEFQKDIQQKLYAAIKETLRTHGEMFVKCAFSDSDVTEHMWVKVVSADLVLRELRGTLDNEPELLTNVKYGDAVTVAFSEVSDITV